MRGTKRLTTASTSSRTTLSHLMYRDAATPSSTRNSASPNSDFLLICTADFAVAEGFGPDVKLTRTQTIMQGAPHCDFRYRRVKAGA